jgi:hypothetical protein
MAARVLDSPGNWRGAARAGFVYTLIVFVIGFAIGAIRVLLVVPLEILDPLAEFSCRSLTVVPQKSIRSMWVKRHITSK